MSVNVSVPEDEISVSPTTDDQEVWTRIFGFTPDDIAVMARYIEVPEDRVTRLIELARFIQTLPREEVSATDLLREAAKGWEPGPGPFTVPMETVNRIVNFLHGYSPEGDQT